MEKFYCCVDGNGYPDKFFISTFNKNIPDDAIEITKEEHAILCSSQDSYKVYQDGTIELVKQPQPSIFHSWNCESAEWYLNINIPVAIINSSTNKKLNDMVSYYSKYERETWSIQAREARYYLEFSPSVSAEEIPMITAIAENRGLTVEELVSKIMENINAFESASGAILGKKQKALDQIDALIDPTAEDLQSIIDEFQASL